VNTENGRDASINSFLPPKEGGGKETNFYPVSAQDLLNEGQEQITWIWQSFLPQGALALFSAYMKVGKSTFLYPLALSIAQGQPFLDYQTTATGVLILAVEERPADVKNRLIDLGLQPQDRLYVHRGTLDYGEATIEALRSFIIDYGIGFVLLDTLSRYWQIRDENDNAEIVRRLNPLLDLARQTGCTILMVHHDKKDGGESGRSIRGGSALFGLVDQALLYDRPPGGNKTCRILRTLGRYSESPSDLVVEWNGKEFKNQGSASDFAQQALINKVWDVLDDIDPKDVAAIAEQSGLKPKSVRGVLEDIESDVIVHGEGKRGSPFRYTRAT
jgi:hypothetical protein